MKKKRKLFIPKELPKDESYSEIDKLIRKSRKEADELINNYLLNNNGSANEPVSIGFYFKYKGIYFFNRHYGNDGLEEEDVKKIAGQLEKVCERCTRTIKEDYVLVKGNEERFYVHVDDIGMVRLPELVESNPDETITQRIYGKTDNPKKVLGLVKRAKRR